MRNILKYTFLAINLLLVICLGLGMLCTKISPEKSAFLPYFGLPKALKDQVAAKLNATAQELYGIENFADMIGDETIAEDPETLMGYLAEKGHPALGMDPMM